MTESMYSSIRSSHSSYLSNLDSWDIQSQLSDLDNLLSDYDLLPPRRHSKGPAPLPPARPSRSAKLSKSTHSLHLIINEDSGCDSPGPSTGSWNGKPINSPVISRSSLGKLSASEIGLIENESKGVKDWDNGKVPQSPAMTNNLKKRFHSEINLADLDNCTENTWGNLFVPRSERKSSLGRFSKSQIILTDIDIDGDCDPEDADNSSDQDADKEVESIFSPQNDNPAIKSEELQFPKPHFSLEQPNIDTSQLASISCFGKVGNKTATKMFLPPALPSEEQRQKVKEMQATRAREKEMKRIKELEQSAAKEREAQKLKEMKEKEMEAIRVQELEARKLEEEKERVEREKQKEIDKEILAMREKEYETNRLQEIEEDKIRAQELEAQRVQEKETQKALEAQKLQDMEGQISQLTKMLGQFSTIIQAKELSYEQGTKSLKKHTSEVVREIYKREQQLLDELEVKHKQDIDQVEDTHKRLSTELDKLKNNLAATQTGLNLQMLNLDEEHHRDSGYEESDYSSLEHVEQWNKDTGIHQVATGLHEMLNEVPSILWSQRTVVRFISAERVPNLGAFQECFMSEDYNKVTKCKAYCQDEETGIKILQKAERQVTPSFIENSSTVELRPTKDSKQRRRAQSMMIIRDNQLSPMPAEIKPPPKRLYLTPQLLHRIVQKGSQPGAIHNPVDACFLPNGHLLVAEFDNSRLQEFDMNGESVQLFNSVPFKPCGVSLTKEGYIATTDRNDRNIKVFTRGGDLVCKFGTGYFKDPSAISVTKSDLYIINENVGPWQQFMFQYNAMTGIKTKIGYDERDFYVINNPEYSYIDKNTDNIFISDSGLHCVWVFNKDLQLQLKFGELGNKNGELSHPKGICCDEEGNILVADCANHRVVKFNSKGHFVEILLGPEQGINYPQVVHLSQQGHLVVVQNSEVLLFQC